MRGRYLLFGGFAWDYPGDAAGTSSGFWALTIGTTAQWIELPSISARHEHSAVYDSVRDQLIVYGGSYNSWRPFTPWNFGTYSDAIAYKGSTNQWTTLQPIGPGPGPRILHGAAMDVSHDRMWLYGGGTSAAPDGRDLNGRQSDLWALNLAGEPNWESFPSGAETPAPGFHGVLSLDADESTLLLVHDGSSTSSRWHRALTQGAEWAASITGGIWPDTWIAYGQLPDRKGAQTLLVDITDNSVSKVADAPGASVQRGVIPTSQPSPVQVGSRQRAGFAYDRTTGSTYLFGGDLVVLSSCASPHGANFYQVQYNDLWRVPSDPAASALRFSPLNPPASRSGTAMVIDRRRRLIVFGGRYGTWTTCATNGGDGFLSDIAFIDLAEPTAWGRINPAGAAPGAWAPDASLYDELRDRMIVLGQTPADDVWALELSPVEQWRSLACQNVQSGALTYRAAVLDSVGDRILVYGLTGNTSLWALALSTLEWSILPTGGTPPPIVSEATRAVFDSRRRRMLVYNGTTPAQPLYEILLEEPLVWRAIDQSEGEPPTSRRNAAVGYDVSTDRIIVMGGYDPATYSELGDIHVFAQEHPTAAQASVASATFVRGAVAIEWLVSDTPSRLRVEMSAGAGLEWSDVGAPEVGARGRLVFRSAVLQYGNRYGFRLAWSADGSRHTMGETWVESPLRGLALSISASTALSTPECIVTLTDAGEARLEVIDLAGRLVGLPLRLQPTVESRRVELGQLDTAANGVYWVRLSQAGRTVSARLALLR